MFFNFILSKDINKLIGKYSDIILALLIILLITVMVIPIPTWLLDILLAINITTGVSILILSIYISESIKIATFPSILLITTLIRLSLNISSTRLILLNGYAGRVINSFGQFVAGGNYIVGGVVFLIITIIQFIVIAKGAERVAEVAARFVLDAMPGKQMSIDADLRAGLIDIEEAHSRRKKLEKEAQFYGAMDGAMKFVKGDAIAGIIIIVVNIIGGFLIGVIMKKMQLLEALQTYTILTIGDGLVSQIPALIISTSAGLIITKVSADEIETNLGKEISKQILIQPKAYAIVSILLISFALMPGLPTMPFIILSAIIAFIAFNLKKQNKEATNQNDEEEERKEFLEFINIVNPILIEVSCSLNQDNKDRDFFKEAISLIRKKLFNELGIILPPATIKENSELPSGSLKILIKEVPVFEIKIRKNKVLVNKDAKELRILGIEVEEGPLLYACSTKALHCCWINKKDCHTLKEKGIQFWEDKDIIKIMIEDVLRKNAYEFIGVQETQSILENLEKYYPALVNSTIPKLISIHKLTDILRRLIQENISIKDMKSIIEAIAEHAAMENDPIMLTEYVRSSLKRYIAWKYASDNSLLMVYLVDPQLEMLIQDNIHQSSTGNFLALDPSISQRIIENARELFNKNSNLNHQPPIFLTQMEIRPFLKRLLNIEFPEAIVLSYQELPSDLQIQPLDKLNIE